MFHGPVWKLRRAEEHLQTFVTEAVEFIKKNVYTFTGEFEAQTSNYVFRIKLQEQVPVRWGTVIGDNLHNLRSALDFLAYDLARFARGGQRPNSQTQFPIIWQDAARYREKGLPYVSALLPQHRTVIRRLQPYQRDNAQEHPLALLNSLSNADKHRLLNATVGQFAGLGPGFTMGQDVQAIREINIPLGPLEDGAEVARIHIDTSGPNPEMEMYGEFDIDIAFADSGRSVMGTLVPIRSEVAAIVEWFAPVFGAKIEARAQPVADWAPDHLSLKGIVSP
jgi:hypothetical protein